LSSVLSFLSVCTDSAVSAMCHTEFARVYTMTKSAKIKMTKGAKIKTAMS
jgi:hypothetical protein